MEVFIQQSPMRDKVDVYVRIRSCNGYEYLHTVDDKLISINIPENECAPEDTVKPILTMPSNLFNQFVKEIAIFASNNNIKTENENLLKGKLQATENHLLSTQSNFDKLLDAMIKKK
jgi:hypothetical protein